MWTHLWSSLPFLLLLSKLAFCAIPIKVPRQCDFTPILSGVTPLQPLGEGIKVYYPKVSDCKQACAAETAFQCKAFLWPAEKGDCYLYDSVDLDKEIFRDDHNSYVLYVQVCSGTATPQIGFCQFYLNQTNVSAPDDKTVVSPGMAAEGSCKEFCIAKYRGAPCDAFIVSPSTKQLSTCNLYATVPSNVPSGSLNMHVKGCSPPPLSCQYGSWGAWSNCAPDCSESRTREIKAEATLGGAPCLRSEMVQRRTCAEPRCEGTEITDGEGDTDDGDGGNIVTLGPGGNAGATTTRPPWLQHDKQCEFSKWGAWDECTAECLQESHRKLKLGTVENCIELYGNAETTRTQPCDGGSCASGGQDDDPNGGTGGGDSDDDVEETGCRYSDIDPQTRPSSQHFLATGLQANCGARCRAETSFECEAFSTTGPGGPCVLHGAIDSATMVVLSSTWYLIDLKCRVNTSATTSICGWQVVRRGIAATETGAAKQTSLGYAINSDHCATLCLMNFHIYRPDGCNAFSYAPNISWGGTVHNCFMYPDVEKPWGFDSTGAYDLYKRVCYANESSVQSSQPI